MVKAAGVAAGTLFVAIGLSAMLGGARIVTPPTAGHNLSQAPPASPQASPSAQPAPQVESVTEAGVIYVGGGKKKHGKG